MGRSQRGQKAAQFSIERVLAHLDQRHPGLPPELRERLGAAIAERVWEPPVSLGKAVGIVLSTYARHERTDYDQLLRKHQLTRDEARLVVQAEHDEMLRSWSIGIEDDIQAGGTAPPSPSGVS
ncbi:DUF2293 domain-containing protein [Brevundimonas diminuta]|jgi:hypothetical protein|uniref:DUF2293 domain-containing protein n=1 Tax=Brevundimonas diminuta TaxID=293 RepID=UPI0006804DF3|nr:DUF2293 domain-containing protein [Brevundimonas diminuta]OWR18808.1 hypothetical protein CD944_10615 [Brevundimonas diminuta]WQE44353.1 DUF2293 domain-containing protein [Brevundimonas diminuta]